MILYKSLCILASKDLADRTLAVKQNHVAMYNTISLYYIIKSVDKDSFEQYFSLVTYSYN